MHQETPKPHTFFTFFLRHPPRLILKYSHQVPVNLIEKKLHSPNPNVRERAILLGLIVYPTTREVAEEHIAELELLADTAGADTVHRVIQALARPDGASYVGKGKVEEVKALIEEDESINLVIVDDDLSPVQLRNLERELEVKVVDRSGLILDIFASRARSREARTQVELAQLLYLMPRLTRMWTHLSKQYGGIGTKGPGETQIETDRRIIKTRISHLREKLTKIETQRETQRKGRTEMFRVSLVGYTNAGKSTLMNELIGETEVHAEDRLFATLDTTVRQVELKPGRTILLSDTVGFIRKLPSHLLAGFHSTLAEAREADLLLHVVDISSASVLEQIAVVEETLKEIEAGELPVLMVFNKIDLVEPTNDKLRALIDRYPDSVAISAATGLGVHALREKIAMRVEETYGERIVRIPISHWHHVAKLHEWIEPLEKMFDDESGYLHFRFSPKMGDYVEKTLAAAKAEVVEEMPEVSDVE
ncbi:MAG: GTPase HflX [Candidatus Kapaibacterium sp.]